MNIKTAVVLTGLGSKTHFSFMEGGQEPPEETLPATPLPEASFEAALGRLWQAADIWTGCEAMLLSVLLAHWMEMSRLEGLSIPYLAAMARMSPRSVNRALAVLADPDKAGVVVRHTARTKADHRASEGSAYEINLERLASWEGQERPKSWSSRRGPERAECDARHETQARAIASTSGTPEHQPEPGDPRRTMNTGLMSSGLGSETRSA